MQCIQLTKKAFALSIVLWIVAALLFGIATLAMLSKDTFSLTKGVNNKLKTRLIAEDVLELLKFYILTADYDSTSFMNNNLNNFSYKFPNKITTDYSWNKIGENTQIRIKDTSSMLNVFSTPPQLIASLATGDNERQFRYVLNDSLTDWIDKDNIVSLNGAESSTYELQKNVAYKIRNSKAIQDVEELKLVQGFDLLSAEKWNLLKNKLFYGKGSVSNLMLIDKSLLKQLLKITENEAEVLMKIRNEDYIKFMKLILLNKAYNDEFMGFYLSKQLRIEIKVSVDEATTIIDSVIDFKRLKDKLYTVIDYKTQ